MPLLAEEVVQEWLNRQGYFTIRGIKVGNSEIDLLAVRVINENGLLRLHCRHVEVQVSHNPIKYITAKSAKRLSPDELKVTVEAWVAKKWKGERQRQIRTRLAPGEWSFEFVVRKHKHPEEIALMRKCGITIHHFVDVLDELRHIGEVVPVAGGADIMGLILLLPSGNSSAASVERLAKDITDIESDDERG